MKLDIDEALRYLGAGRSSSLQLRQQVAAVARELEETITPRYVYRITSLEHREEGILLPEIGVTLTGHSARTMLTDCRQAVVLACTLGLEFDGLLRRQQARDMARGAILDACGSAWVEWGCDRAGEEIQENFPHLYQTDRFSPGYGDLPLDLQPALCDALDAQRRLGLYVTPSLMLNPAKSVTALIGLSHRPQQARIRGCAHCSLKDSCTLRTGGNTCGI